jgi:hypothetical protein
VLIDPQPAVQGLVLPDSLIVALRSGLWFTPVAPHILEAIFADDPDARFSTRFYSLDEMRTTTLAVPLTVFLGLPPDDMDPAKWVWIGEVGFDRPLVLDYRQNPPSVRFLNVRSRWIVVAASVDALLKRLGKLDGAVGDRLV